MTVVRPNSIAGINSITVQTGQALNIHDANGNLIRNITSSTGISTFQSVEVTSGDLTVGVSTLFVDKSAARIGIGTNVPDASLSIGDGSTTTYMSLKAGTTNSAVINFGDTADDNIGQFYYYNTDNAFRWTTNTVADRMTLDSSGRLLIGTTTEGHDDSDDLTINGTRTGITIRSASDNYGNIFFSDATSGTGEYVGAVQYYHADNTLRLKTSSADKLIINSAGDVNISGVTTAAAFIPSMGQLSHRNLIINGAMAVNQYGTSSTSSGMKHIDRWAMYAEGANTTLTQSKVDVAAGTAPYQLGFRSAFKILNAGQSNSNVGGDTIRIEQHIEDQMLARSGWDYKS